VRRRGVILVVVMVITALASVVAASLLFRMQAEVSASAASARGDQARAAAMSGIRRAMTLVAQTGTDTYDNPDLLHNQLVFDDGTSTWYFTVYAYNPTDPDNLRYGLTDSGARIDVNTADEQTLLALPGMTQELVDALLDYRDEDDTPRPQGAEQDHYDRLARPYLIPNGPLAGIEELLMVKGFNAPVVYGEDANLNGLLDPNEDDRDERFPPDNGDGTLDRGLLAFLAVRPPSAAKGDDDTVSVLEADRAELEEVGLPDETVRFILVVREENPPEEAEGGLTRMQGPLVHRSRLLEATYELREDHEEFELQAGTNIESGVGADELPTVMERLRVAETDSAWQGVNVNTAPAEVLATLPGADEYLAQRIVDYRSGLSVEEQRTCAWLYTRGVLDAEQFKEIAPHVTTRSTRYEVRCLGFGVPCGRFCTLEATLDVSGERPRIVFLRDITRLGLPFVPDADELEQEG
jgi:DNA uptake protein ComE-like DNA-binding protein